MIAFFQAHAAWVPPITFVLAFFKSLAFISLVVPETLMVAAVGALVGITGADIWPVWLTISLGAGLGDWVSYSIGYRYKQRAWRTWPFTRWPGLVPRGERFFHRWGAMSVVLCRFVSPLRATVPLLCGIFEMPPLTFQIANWLSAILWSGVILGIGVGVGRLFG
jgi:membrane protein DedA with SNARE-associated domain